ncbi:hypothetical protein [Bdellovibrio sp. NC01]|uniref:hypothetical protein n=1 Tax=Bdellovibrio sp. NC01 TaxID=2220073 RepID=UPI0011578AF3|nr:hypothetical protein [Bdellovibrio sp. NC01]
MKIPEGQTSFTPKEVADFLIAIGRIQFDLFLSEIPLRGGVSIGKVHFDLNQKVVIGPAYIEAYELELQAKYPRVIVSSRLIKELNLETHADLILCVNQIYQDSGQQALYNWDRFGDNGLGKLQKDIPFFIDFLRAKEGRIQVIQDRLDDHVEILNKLTIDNPNHYLKYKWLQDYWLTTYGQALGKYDGKTVRYLTSIS